MNRKIITLMMASAFVLSLSSMALGFVDDIDQKGGDGGDTLFLHRGGPGPWFVDAYQKVYSSRGDNDLYIGQAGKYIGAKVKQRAKRFNDAIICQLGRGLWTDVTQEGAKKNWAYVKQVGHCSGINVEQEVTRRRGHWSKNEAKIIQKANWSQINIDQKAGRKNEADVVQTGSCSYIDVEQTATRSNDLKIRQIGSGHSNLIRLKQDATGGGCGQCGPAGGYNEADIRQYGSKNKLVGAKPVGNCRCGCSCWCPSPCFSFAEDAAVAYCRPATQIGLYNELNVCQSGYRNTIGLYQNAPNGYNMADITQTGCHNTVAIYQDNSNGNNIVNVKQDGHDQISVSQVDFPGDSIINIDQT